MSSVLLDGRLAGYIEVVDHAFAHMCAGSLQGKYKDVILKSFSELF